ncbi:terminase large subunit domain-containing protein [Basfia succiniciproducens]|uniref:terminase large subunit domain-containing protein n=1 Tax=Basfia succiniciproducens TaxID=653940 RepID=UPI003FCE63C2
MAEKQTEKIIENATALLTINIQRDAKLKYFAGYSISEIARLLNVPVSTVASWKKREKWDEADVLERVSSSLEMRYCQLIQKDVKTGSDLKELDFLMRQMKDAARIQKYQGDKKESTLNPKLENRHKGERKSKDQNPISAEQEELLINGFFDGIFHYQRKWYDAGLQYRIREILKSRQIGATYFFAREALVNALKTGDNQIFLSASKKQALQFKSYIKAYAKEKADVNLKGDTILLPNGAELIFLGTNAATAQSYHGNLYFDEYFWVPKFAEIRKVAAAMASQKKYHQTYFSTPTTTSSDAYQFWSGKSFNRRRSAAEKAEFDISHDNLSGGKLMPDRHWKQIVTIYDAEAGGCKLFDIEELRFENSVEEFEQLYLCQFADDKSSVFKFDELQLCQLDAYEEWHDFKPHLLRPFGNREVWLGYDPAYTGDRAALVLVAPPRVEGGDFRLLHHETFHGLDFAAQAEKIRQFTQNYHISRMAIDKTGMGTGVYQLVKQFYPAVVGLDYDVNLKNEMVLKMLNLVQKRRFKYDLGDKEVTASFMTIKRQTTRSGRQMTYVSDRSEEASHGDIAWAIMSTILNEPFGGASANNQSIVISF